MLTVKKSIKKTILFAQKHYIWGYLPIFLRKKSDSPYFYYDEF